MMSSAAASGFSCMNSTALRRARITARTVELFHNGSRVASHVRSSSNRGHTTIAEHMPSSHRRYAEWTPERLQRRAAEIGRNTAILVEIIMRERTHPEQGFRACVGIMRLAKGYSRERFEAACASALRPSSSLTATEKIGAWSGPARSRST